MKSKYTAGSGGLTRLEFFLILTNVAMLAAVAFTLNDKRKIEQLALSIQNSSEIHQDYENGMSHSFNTDSLPDAGRELDPPRPVSADASPAPPTNVLASAGLRLDTSKLNEKINKALEAEQDDTSESGMAINDIADVEKALAAIDSMEWGPDSEKTLQEVLSKWSKIDTLECLAFVMDIDSRRVKSAALNSILSEWAARSPSEAVQWLSSQYESEPGLMATAAGKMFRQMAGTDPAAALLAAQNVQQGSLMKFAIQGAISGAMKSGNQAVVDQWINQLSAYDQKVYASKAVVNSLSQYKPDAAMEWINGLADQRLRNDSMNTLVAAWGKDQPVKVAAWLLSQQDTQQRSSQIGTLVKVWAEDNPKKASTWLAAQGPPKTSLDPAVVALVDSASKSNPLIAIEWAGVIADTKTRWKMTERLAWSLMNKDPGKAMAVVAASDLPASIKKRFVPRAGSGVKK